MAYGLSNGHVADDVTGPQGAVRQYGRYSSDSLDSCFLSSTACSYRRCRGGSRKVGIIYDCMQVAARLIQEDGVGEQRRRMGNKTY